MSSWGGMMMMMSLRCSCGMEVLHIILYYYNVESTLLFGWLVVLWELYKKCCINTPPILKISLAELNFLGQREWIHYQTLFILWNKLHLNDYSRGSGFLTPPYGGRCLFIR